MTFLTLFHRYILRDLWGKPARTLLTLAGVALGVAVVVAVHLSNQRAIGSFTDSLSMICGSADYRIDANGLPLDEKLLEDLSWFWEFGSLAALVEGRAGLPGGDSVRLYGIDLLAEAPFRQYLSEDRRDLFLDVTAQEFLDLLVDPGRLIVPAALAEKRGLGKGSKLKLVIGERESEFTVGALLADQGAARAFGGNVVFMDIAAAQLALGKIGSLDSIDLAFFEGADQKAALEGIRRRLPAAATLSAPQELAARGDRMLAAFRFNLAALSYLSLIVGVILVYNTLNLAVVRRQPEIAALRTLGTTRMTILWMFLLEAVTLGLVGSALGLWLGTALAGGAEALVSRTVETLYTGVASTPFRAGGERLFLAGVLVLGAALGAVSGLFPAWRATTRSPVTVLRQGFLAPGRRRSYRAQAWAGLSLCAAAAGLCLLPPAAGVPVGGYAGAVAFIGGFGLMAPLLARQVLGLLEGRVRRLLPVEVMLALQSVQGGLGRVIVAVVCLMIATAMLVSVATMVGSFRQTVNAWVDQTWVADLYVKASGAGVNDWESPLSPATVKTLEELPGVEAIGKYRGRTIAFRGGLVTLAGGDFAVLASHANLLFLDGRSTAETVGPLIGQEKVLVSEPFSLKYGVRAGDSVTLPTAEGPRSFEVASVYYDYSSDRGVIVLDREPYRRLFRDSAATSLSVFLQPGQNLAQVRQRIASALPESHLSVLPNADLKRAALTVFDQTFQVTYALEVIAILVAALGVANTLAALLVERQGELALLRFLGASRNQIRRMAVVESGVVGFLGLLVGTLLGLVLSLVLVYVINRQSFGWTIQFDLPALFLGGALLLVLAATVAAGAYPAAAAARSDPIRSLRAE